MTSQTTTDRPSEGIRLGRLLGVPVFLKPSWFLVAVVITVIFAPTATANGAPSQGAAYAIAFTFAVLLLLSVLVHELAHAVAAKATGTPATHIVLDLWGGHTAFDQDSRTPWRGVVVAAVGPLSNLAMAVAALPFLAAVDDPVVHLLLRGLTVSNVVVAVFNALPGLPLDGGRVLEALVWWVTGDRHRATRVAGWSGRVVAALVAVWTVGRVLSERMSPASAIWLLLIAGLLWHSAGQSIRAGRWFARAARARAADLLRPAVAVPSTATVRAALRTAAEAHAEAVVVLDVYGRPAAVVDDRAAQQVPADRTAQVGAAAVAEALVEGAVLDRDLDGDALLARMRATPAPRYVVLAGGEVVGVLDWDDVARFVTDATA